MLAAPISAASATRERFPQQVREVCQKAAELRKGKLHDTQLAFFGGSFTAIERGYMLSLLEAAKPFVWEDGFAGIRISTRPDAINEEILTILKEYHVNAIELGVQSMNDRVLLANKRGHTAQDVLTKDESNGSFSSAGGQHTVTYVTDDSLPDGQYYLYLFNNNLGYSESRPDYDWSQIDQIATDLSSGTTS